MDAVTLAAARAYTDKVTSNDGAGPHFAVRRVAAVSTSRELIANTFAPIRHEFTDGDITMTDGLNFMAPSDGLYVFSSRLSRATVSSTRQDVVLSKNGTSTEAANVLTQKRVTTSQESGNAPVSIIPAITHAFYLNAGETVAFSLRSQAAQAGFDPIEFEFFLVSASHDCVKRKEFEELKAMHSRITVMESEADALAYSAQNPNVLVFFPESD